MTAATSAAAPADPRDGNVAARAWHHNAVLAFVGDIAAKANAVVVLTIASHQLSLAEFSSLTTALAATFVLMALLDGGAMTLIVKDGAAGPEARGSVFRGLALARAPVAAAAFAVAVVGGIATDRVELWLATWLLVVATAASWSFLALLRSSQDFMPEAWIRTGTAIVAIAATTIAGETWHTAGAVMLAFGAVVSASLVPLWVVARGRARFTSSGAVWAILRRALPLGLLTIIVSVYYRSGTIALSIFSSHTETARFGIASPLAFGLLSAAQAAFAGLLARLSAEHDGEVRAALMRKAVRGTLVVGIPGAIVAAGLGPVALTLLFPDRYHDAAVAFAILCSALPVIAATSMLAAGLLAGGHVRPVVEQALVSLVVNLVLLAALAGPLGANGAAIATVGCEVAGLAFTVWAVERRMPGSLFVKGARA